MARTAEEVLKLQIGSLLIELAQAIATNEALLEKNQLLQSKQRDVDEPST